MQGADKVHALAVSAESHADSGAGGHECLCSPSTEVADRAVVPVSTETQHAAAAPPDSAPPDRALELFWHILRFVLFALCRDESAKSSFLLTLSCTCRHSLPNPLRHCGGELLQACSWAAAGDRRRSGADCSELEYARTVRGVCLRCPRAGCVAPRGKRCSGQVAFPRAQRIRMREVPGFGQAYACYTPTEQVPQHRMHGSQRCVCASAARRLATDGSNARMCGMCAWQRSRMSS